MKIAPYVEKLNASDEYKNFQKQYDDAFMIAGFFILDLESGQHVHQIDYYVPSKKKVAAFTLDRRVTLQMLDLLNKKVPEKLDIKMKIDLESLPGILEDEMKNRNITETIKKIIAIVQMIDGKKVWNLNCILSGMSILNAHIEDESQSVLKMERKSLMDIMQKIPAAQLRQQQELLNKPATRTDAEQQLQKLNELGAAIEKEKERLLKEAQQKGKGRKGTAEKKSGKKVQAASDGEETNAVSDDGGSPEQ